MTVTRLFCTAIAVGTAMLTHAVGAEVEMPTTRLNKTPRASFVAFVPKVAISKFVSQLKRYAAKQAFQVHSRETRPGLHFLVVLDRADAQIIALNPFDPVDPAEFRVDVYDANAGATLQKAEVASILEQLRVALCPTEGIKCTSMTTENH